MDILIDFDGTCVAHDFPRIGKDIGSVKILKKLIAAGHHLILFTMRSDVEKPISEDKTIIAKSGKYLTDAIKAMSADEITISFSGELKPLIITDANDPSITQLISPVRTYR